MAKVTFIKDGKKQEVEAPEGATLLETAQKNGVEMEAACGGNGFCLTCRCRVREGKLGEATDREEMMGLTGEERLGCQAKVRGDVTVELE